MKCQYPFLKTQGFSKNAFWVNMIRLHRKILRCLPGGKLYLRIRMLEKPNLPDHLIASRLQSEYGLNVARLIFLPLGADVATAVYRVITEDEIAYFLKLRKGIFDEISVAVPQFLKSQDVQAIIAPIETRKGQLWGNLGAFRMILYPFIHGKNGYHVILSDQQWVDFGKALKLIHAAQIPAGLLRLIPRENYSPRWRNMVRYFQRLVETTTFKDPIAHKLAAFMQARQSKISYIVERANLLGLELASRSLEFICCHSDIHPGNLLIAENNIEKTGRLYIVDWDNPILAPTERDLTLIGGSFHWKDASAVALFYQGYTTNSGFNTPEIDQTALAYFRYERIIQDIAAFCEQLLLTPKGGDDREQAYHYFTSTFLPNHELEIAISTEKSID
jgi:spectinomycin phosphotransferase